MQEKKILGLGNLLTDILHRVSEDEAKEIGLKQGGHISPHKINQPAIDKICANKMPVILQGGGSANTLRSLANLGNCNCTLVGAVGDDSEGELYKKQLEKEGIQHHIKTAVGKQSGKCYTFITPDKERSFVVDKGAMQDFPKLKALQLTGYDLFHTSGYEVLSNPEAVLEFVKALAPTTKISFDVATINLAGYESLFRKIISHTRFLFVSPEETKALGGLEDSVYDKTIIALKKGERGSTIFYKDCKIDMSSIPANPLVNTNGAGDSYAAGFLWSQLHGFSLTRSAKNASYIASRVCSQKESWYKG